MYSTTVYLYQQITRVLLVDTSGGYFTMRYEPVYAKTLTVNKGVDNVLLFEFINQDQKPVNITGSTFVFRLISQNGDDLFVEKSMDILSAPLGRVKVVLTPEDTDDIEAQPASYSIQRTQGNYQQAVFVDANAGARANCNIVDSIFPQFVPSAEITVPDIYGNENMGSMQVQPTNWPDWAQNPQPLSYYAQTEYYSSYIPSNESGFTTIKMDLINFTGTIKVQGAPNYQSEWYNVTESRQYLNATESVYFNVLGYHPLLRVALNSSVGYGASANVVVTNGVVTSVIPVNGGYDYVASPRVQILGTGAGAVVTANITGNAVTSYNVVSGGSGYIPEIFGNNVYATALISNGEVINIHYR